MDIVKKRMTDNRRKNINFAIIFTCIISIIMFFLSGAVLHAQNLDMERLAQYNLNYASYLIDVGKYMEALDSYETAYEVTQYPKTKAKALLHKASLLANFLDNFDESLKTYDQILKEYPEFGETALYKKGLLLFDLQRYEEAVSAFDHYMKDHPEGIQRFSVEILRGKALEAIGKPVPPAPPLPPEPEPVERPLVRVALARKAKSALISGKGIDVIADGKAEARGDNLTVEFSDSGIRINNKVMNASRVRIKAASPPITLTVSGEKKSVRGSLDIMKKDSNLMIINVVDIEEYLYGVVPSE
ncbi:tetratricopeptide repeat protein, partial [bacterium]|nr:tetratricopeptide repeat protein [bacterium]